MNLNVKVIIIESSVLIRSGIISLLRQLHSIQMEVFEIADIELLKNVLGGQKPDILIVNPSALGAFSLQQIKRETANPTVKCVALQHALFDNSALKVYDEIISIYDSAEQINEKLKQLIVESETEVSKRHDSLTSREKEIITCVIKGMTNKQIAEKLYLSTHTVITHRRNIASKLQIHSVAGLTIYAIVNKLVELDEIKDLPPIP